ncbi:PE-PPE domain-containing protein [Mycobacterium sp.]|uniref:PE-PPE domain-containing protein n=1 Tax=Mycobacterium sp. TaxID=1785 RepID=UPI00128082AD|nr:PE-PPE domain-containing protein [Mycobacterium sp.]KAA8968966.1 MAG: PE-PPE domain-containing protein [Mycobacterium sp.]
MRRASRLYLAACVTVLGAALVAAPPLAPKPRVQAHAVQLTDAEGTPGIADIMAGSGTPIPSEEYVEHVFDVFVKTLPQFENYTPEPVFYPAGNYALYTGVKSLPLDTSEAQGTQILTNMITQQVGDGFDVVMKGQSQSSTIAGMTMTDLAAQNVPDDKVSFVLTGDPNLPNGGLFERADGLYLPSLGITFNGATPSDLYPTTIYTLEYDGFADVCQYPINALCDLNSILGILYVHPTYSQVVTPEQLAAAIPWPTEGPSMTDYYILPTADLPLLDPLRALPVVGNPLADLLQPDLEVLVNLGYGNPDYGWSQGPANVPTPFGLFPSLADLEKVPAALVAGTQQGISDFVGAVDSEATAFSSSATAFLSDPSAALSSMLGEVTSGLSSASASMDALSLSGIADEFTTVVNALTGAVSSAYATLLPTADVITAVLVTLPTYDLDLFAQGLQDGNLLEAIGQPIASDTYLIQLAAGFEIFSVIDQVTTVIGDLSGILP